MKHEFTSMDKLVEWFQLRFPKAVEYMRTVSHHYDVATKLNPYHIEGDIWCHTLMVANVAKMYDYQKEVQIASFLHDLGKPTTACKNEVKGRTSFFGHEGMSAWLALDVLKELELSQEEIIQIFNLIALHTEPFKISPEKLSERLRGQEALGYMLNRLNRCDTLGRLCTTPNEDRFDEINELLVENAKKGFQKRENLTHEVILLFGLPCSGKSTYFEKELKKKGFTLLSRDAILEELVEGDTYNEKWNNANQKEIDRVFNDRLNLAIKKRENIVVDRTNLTRKSRRKILNRFPKCYKKTCVGFLVNLMEIFERNENREGKVIPDGAYDYMMKSTYPPLYDEFDEIEWIVNLGE